jgi:hypothetical protein
MIERTDCGVPDRKLPLFKEGESTGELMRDIVQQLPAAARPLARHGSDQSLEWEVRWWGSGRSFIDDMLEPVCDTDFQVFAMALNRAELRFELHDEDALHDPLSGVGRFELEETLETIVGQTFEFQPGQGWRAAVRALVL